MLSGETIRELGIFNPFSERVSNPGSLMSYGCGFCGYDIRLGNNIVIPPGTSLSISELNKIARVMPDKAIDIDPLGSNTEVHDAGPVDNLIPRLIADIRTWRKVRIPDDWRLILSTNTFVLGESVEHITVPADCVGLCFGKSTYARFGLLVNVTPLEPGWSGYLTIEIANVSSHSGVFVYIRQGIAQIVFSRLDRQTAGYSGSWQNQQGATVTPTACSSDTKKSCCGGVCRTLSHKGFSTLNTGE